MYPRSECAQCCWFMLLFRSGAVEDHAEAVGDVPVTVGEGNRAAGWGNRLGLTVFGGEQQGEIHSFTSLQQTAPGAQDTVLTPARYRSPGPITKWCNMLKACSISLCFTYYYFQMCPLVIKSSRLSWGSWFGRKCPSASSMSVCSTPSPPTAASWRNTTLYVWTWQQFA